MPDDMRRPPLRLPSDLHSYQQRAVNHQCSRPESMLWLDMGLGKLQPNSEPVLTAAGWVPMGDLRPGDMVIGSNGEPTEVVATFPQGEQEVIRVTFTDGSWCRVGWDHLWYVQNPLQKARNTIGHVMTTRQLVENGLDRISGQRGLESFWYIPMVQPVEFPAEALPMDPYLLGVVLGDGCNAANGGVTVCTDREIIDACGLRYLRDHENGGYTAYASIPGCQAVIRELDLDGKRSWEKHVPEMYLRGSAADRLALLQGLLDTDGSPIADGGVEFSSTSEMLIDAVVELAQSLGGNPRKSEPRITNHQNGPGRVSWRVNVKIAAHLTPFRLKRKLDKWKRPTKYPAIRKMLSAVVDGREESTCIKVAAADSLYVTRNYIVTHNTAITLTSIAHLVSTGFLRGVLVIAPIRVCRLVWRQEADRWAHTKHMKFSMVLGTRDQRTRALLQPADVHLINYDCLGWLAETLEQYFVSKGKPIPFNGIVFDESAKLKNSTTQRVKSFMKIADNFIWATGLTGTPASNGFKDLHGQYLVVDKGKRLGRSKTQFRTRFYKKAGPFKEVPYPDTESTIKELIGDITLEMSAEEYNKLPDMIVNDVEVELPPEARLIYDQMERDLFARLDSGKEVERFNEAAKTNTCLQLSNGFIYPVAGMPLWERVHDAKLDALEDIVDDAQGSPVFCAYQFRADAERIMQKFASLRPINLTACQSESALVEAMRRFQTGECALMIGHPASVSHGLDGFQKVCHILAWYGLTWSLDLYLQFIARIRRQGQTYPNPLMCHRILCKNTLDQAQALALDSKSQTQNALRQAVRDYRLTRGF